MYTLNRTGNLTCLRYSNKAYYTEHSHMRHCKKYFEDHESLKGTYHPRINPPGKKRWMGRGAENKKVSFGPTIQRLREGLTAGRGGGG